VVNPIPNNQRRARRVTPFDDRAARFGAGRHGTWLFLVSLAMLFGASLIGFLILRLQIGAQWPADLPALPSWLWLSTALLVISSGTIQWAVRAASRDPGAPLRRALVATLILGVAFLVLQVVAWVAWIEPVRDRWSISEEYRFALTSFYVLTGLHALHVIGGLVPMAIVTQRALAGRYVEQAAAGAFHGAGVRYCAMYWHFLDGVWIVLFASMLIGV
jgi:cytochrome c oxidase subunit 3